jgi:hypothetical protein
MFAEGGDGHADAKRGSFFWCKVEEDKQWMTTATASAVKVGIRRRYRVAGRVVGGGTTLGAARYILC